MKPVLALQTALASLVVAFGMTSVANADLVLNCQSRHEGLTVDASEGATGIVEIKSHYRAHGNEGPGLTWAEESSKSLLIEDAKVERRQNGIVVRRATGETITFTFSKSDIGSDLRIRASTMDLAKALGTANVPGDANFMIGCNLK